MILISHRGNIDGKNPELENSPDYINKALNAGYNVEIDVWNINGQWFLGHDGPQYKIDKSFLINDKLWCHAKNINALNEMLDSQIHCFWHQKDDVTLTNRDFMWTYPGQHLTEKSVCVLPELADYKEIKCAGVCSDYIKNYR